MTTESPWMTEHEAAEYARVSVETLRGWRKRQKKNLPVPVKSHKFGARVLYHRDDIDRAIRS